MSIREKYKQAYRLARIIWKLQGTLDDHCLEGSRYDVVGVAISAALNAAKRVLHDLQKSNMNLYWVQNHYYAGVKLPPRNCLMHEMLHSENPPEMFKRVIVTLHREGKFPNTMPEQAIQADRDDWKNSYNSPINFYPDGA